MHGTNIYIGVTGYLTYGSNKSGAVPVVTKEEIGSGGHNVKPVVINSNNVWLPMHYRARHSGRPGRAQLPAQGEQARETARLVAVRLSPAFQARGERAGAAARIAIQGRREPLPLVRGVRPGDATPDLGERKPGQLGMPAHGFGSPPRRASSRSRARTRRRKSGSRVSAAITRRKLFASRWGEPSTWAPDGTSL